MNSSRFRLADMFTVDICGSPNAQLAKVVILKTLFSQDQILFVDTGLGFCCEQSTSAGLNLEQGLLLLGAGYSIFALSPFTSASLLR